MTLKTLLGLTMASSIITAPIAFADDAKKETKSAKFETKSAKPEATPGWIVLEEDFWYPWRYNASDSLHHAEVHYRTGEEKAAARELKSAATWLAFAATHAEPITKGKLTKAMATLEGLAKDLQGGKAITARELDSAMAAANHSLAEWHYYKGNSKLAKDDVKAAAHHLATAAHYLDNAAKSARYEYGEDTIAMFDDVYRFGDFDLGEEGLVMKPKHVEANFNALKKEIDGLGETLLKSVK